MNLKKSAFTMIEVVFVIVVLGILAAIAIPKFTATRTDAVIAKGRSDVASIRTAISTERQKRFMKGESSYINYLDGTGVAGINAVNAPIFDNNGTTKNVLLTYGITTKDVDGGWLKIGINSYAYRVRENQWNRFDYNNADGTFKCTAGIYCDQLSK